MPKYSNLRLHEYERDRKRRNITAISVAKAKIQITGKNKTPLVPREEEDTIC
jgi:hypothetical protein